MSRKMVRIREAAEFLGVAPLCLRRLEREGRHCGRVHDRDPNTARNPLAYGLAALSGSTASSAGCKACGEEGSGRHRKTAAKPASVKQEVSFVPV